MIEIINLSKSFNGKPVLKKLNLTVQSGETLVVIGRSGCGKSVLLKHIIGIMRPEGGQILIDGEDVARAKGRELERIRMKFGMLFQGSALFDSLTIGENVGFALQEHTTMDERSVATRVRECLQMVGLKGIEEMKPSELSGGMRKRVGLARAIARNPQLILYDEPTTGIDPIMGDAINDLIKALHDKLKVTSIAVTHDMTSAYKIASRIAMLYDGKIVEVGTSEEIRHTSNPIVRQFVTGAATGPITTEE
ncbi:MAG: ABC transporter ATP-binding protein [Candidatus Omnitrophica bacterium]|nr:ABC transporter ATP-binding protein [Candidatus Omnitrophota bacterium]